MSNLEDITLVIEAMSKNKESAKQLERLREYYHFTLSSISHELKNTISYINSSLQLIENLHPEVTDFDYWGQAMSDLQYMILLLNDITQFSGTYNVNFSEVNILNLIFDVKKMFTLKNQEKHCSIIINSPSDLPLIPGDKIKLKQVLINLIKNSYDAINVNGIIKLLISIEEPFLKIDVSDNGCGISKDQLIWNLFVTSKAEGTGIGLPISQSIIQAHGGKLFLSNSSEHETTFTMLLPLQKENI